MPDATIGHGIDEAKHSRIAQAGGRTGGIGIFHRMLDVRVAEISLHVTDALGERPAPEVVPQLISLLKERLPFTLTARIVGPGVRVTDPVATGSDIKFQVLGLDLDAIVRFKPALGQQLVTFGGFWTRVCDA